MTPEFEIDWDRAGRTGVPEAVLCGHKSPGQISAILSAAMAQQKRLLLTRLETTTFSALDESVRSALDYDPDSGTAVLGGAIPLVESGIGIVAAGTSDMRVAREAQRTLAFCGLDAAIIADVGVAGLWRLTARLPKIRQWRVVIAIAGMEGAIFSVLAGLIAAPVIAVPSSVGYGVGAQGMAALHAALSSCAPGVVVVNIDNGFGAAAAALKMLSVR